LHIAPSGKALLRQYLIESAPKARARVTNRIGWHDAGPEGAVYVLPDTAIGTAAEAWLCEAEGGAASTFIQRGTLKGWQEEIAARCVGNSRLAFSVSVAFAAPLLYLTGGEGGGFHFRSSSSDGKTTALRVAASVCGGHDYMRRWRATDNAIEAIALQHCDAPLLLDEIAQTDPKAAGEIAYMLANGSGKIRAGRTGAAREVVQWRVLFLSAGEIGLAEHMGEAGKIMRAGQSLRMAEIPADAGAGLGIFENLHGHADGAVFAKALAEAWGRTGHDLRGCRGFDCLAGDAADCWGWREGGVKSRGLIGPGPVGQSDFYVRRFQGGGYGQAASRQPIEGAPSIYE